MRKGAEESGEEGLAAGVVCFEEGRNEGGEGGDYEERAGIGA